MAKGGSFLMLLVVLLALWLALASKETCYQKFLRQHIDFPKTDAPDASAYCNLMMQHQGMTSPFCEFTNTFIHADTSTIRNVCGREGIPLSWNQRDSKSPFSLTTCRLVGRSQKPPCNYRGSTSTKHIRISCDRGLPVHFD